MQYSIKNKDSWKQSNVNFFKMYKTSKEKYYNKTTYRNRIFLFYF